MRQLWAATTLCRYGNTPPPTTIIMKIPDAFAVYLPSPSRIGDGIEHTDAEAADECAGQIDIEAIEHTACPLDADTYET